MTPPPSYTLAVAVAEPVVAVELLRLVIAAEMLVSLEARSSKLAPLVGTSHICHAMQCHYYAKHQQHRHRCHRCRAIYGSSAAGLRSLRLVSECNKLCWLMRDGDSSDA